MIKVILVDDETLVKVGLKSLADWEKLGYEIIAEGSNGEEGLALIKEYNPQLVITDIVMPKMDGIEMMCKTKEYNPNIQVIVLSSYDEFQLVRKSMKFGAWDYILKLNISKESMNEILERVKETIIPLNEMNLFEVKKKDPVSNYDNWSLSALRQVFLKGLIENSINDAADISGRQQLLNMQINGNKMRLCIIETNLYSIKEKYCGSQDIRQLDNMMTDILTEIGNEFFPSYFLKWSFGEYVLVYSMDKETDEEITELTDTMCSTIIEMIKKYMNLDASIGISNIFSGYQKLPEAFKQANEAISDMFFSGYGRAFYYNSECSNAAARTEAEFGIDLKEELPKAISLFDISGINNIFQTLQNNINGNSIEKSSIYNLCTQMFCLCNIHMGDQWQSFKKKIDNDEFKIDTIYSMRTISEITEWLSNYCSRIVEYMDECKRDDKHVMIVKAKNFIVENCERALNLKEVADHLIISEGYLSGLFHKYTGMCFTEYVNVVKIERAQQFIRQGQYKIYEISYMLGFDNACYFSKVFKKMTGFTPTEYQQRCIVEQNNTSV